MVKGVRKSRKQNRSNLFQPLFILEFEVYHKEATEMHLVKEVSRATPLNSIPYDLTKSTQAIFMAEVLYRAVREEEPNPVLAQFLMYTIQLLDALEEPSPDFHIVFLFQLTKYLGFYPKNNYGDGNIFFNLVSGSFKSGPGDPAIQLAEEASDLWRRCMMFDYQSVKDAELNGAQRKSVLDQLVRYYKLHVDGMGEIRSLEVLHDFFHN